MHWGVGNEKYIYLDPPTRAKFALIGSTKVVVVATGQQRTQVSVCFTTSASGNKLFDQAPCHTTQRVRKNFVNASVDSKSIPKRMTSFVQPADVCWMKPLKAAYFNKWNQWLINAPRSFTAAGNRKSLVMRKPLFGSVKFSMIWVLL